ncbi:MAG: helix-turn-helix domain-containing protein [Micromonosporaceae bacterium]|nr:helix-turn-helix domain-containing protein [Micromonosporaceae bacterium]
MRAEREHVTVAPDVSWHYHVWRAAEFRIPWHYHPELELALITEGSGTRIVGDSVESYRPGDLTLIGAELPHTYLAAPGGGEHEAIVVQFRRDFLGSQLLTHPEFAGLARLLDRAARGLWFEPEPRLAARLWALATAPPPERTLELLGLLVRLAGDQSARVLATAPGAPRLSGPARRRIEAVCSYLQAAYPQPVRLADVAAVAHLTPAALSRFFRRALGRTLTDYLTELRIAEACRLLTGTELPIATIAARSGYPNLANFHRRFRALKGTSPRAYRRAGTRDADRRY